MNPRHGSTHSQALQDQMAYGLARADEELAREIKRIPVYEMAR